MSDTRILIVDDNLMTRNVLARHLQTMGFAGINRAASCELAARLLAEAYGKGEPFHLVLLDWHMPDMQGDKFGNWVTKPTLPDYSAGTK
jgi:two-component system, sensor histidine kinase and response regulator